MINKLKLIALLLGVWSTRLVAQDSLAEYKRVRQELLFYKQLYSTADSLQITGKTGYLGAEVFRTADTADKDNPVTYFYKVPEFMKDKKYVTIQD